MFLRLCSPISAKSAATLPRTCRKASTEMQMPPGSAMPSRRAAILTPSPMMSSPSIRTSPRCRPMRKSIRRASETPSLRCVIRSCSAIAHWTARTTEPNSISRPSPVVLKIRPLCWAISGSAAPRCSRNACAVPASSSPNQPGVAGDIGGEDRGEAAGLAHAASPAARRRPDR